MVLEWSLNTRREGPTWSWFDVKRYARFDALADAAARAGDAAAIADYQLRGEALGYSPNSVIDPVFYHSTYRGIDAAISDDDHISAFDHFRTSGWRCHSPHWLFSSTLYRLRHSDLIPPATDGFGGLYGHYVDTGAREGRIAHRFFDPRWYAAQCSGEEAKAAADAPFQHYLASLEEAARKGLPEPHASLFFDPVWYLANYPDVAKAVAAGQYLGALHHYIIDGMSSGYDPLSNFTEMEYRARYPDVSAAVAAGEYRNGYEHFLAVGAAARRCPCRHVDLAFYVSQPTVARDLAAGTHIHGFEHLLAVGIPCGLALLRGAAHDIAPDEAEARRWFLTKARSELPGYGRNRIDFTSDGSVEVSIIMILHNQFALTMQALASLRANFAGGMQLILVDSASHDGTISIEEVVLGVKLIRVKENIGFVRGCNLALEFATAPAILYINNDVVLHPNALRLALARLNADATVGAVGGKIVRTHGLLQEAGSLLWSDGSVEGWLRDARPDAPEANYVRDVDFCSAAFLLVRGDLLRTLGGFADEFAPAYYEDVDLCLRILGSGHRVVYDPAVVLTHFEYASSHSVAAAAAQMQANRETFRARHATLLRTRPSNRDQSADAAAFASRGRRVLFVEDTVPIRRLGSGYGRANDVVHALVEAGWRVTVFPMHPIRAEPFQIAAELPETVEFLWDRDSKSLPSFFAGRSDFYDVVWISRAHNLRLLKRVLGAAWASVERARIVLDTEAVFSLRDAGQARLNGLLFDLHRSLANEFQDAAACDLIIAVNEAEAHIVRRLGLTQVGVVGLRQLACPTPRRWAERGGLLHVGALTADSAPNMDGLRWFLEFVHPLVEAAVGRDAARLTIAGFVLNGVDVSWLRGHPAVDFVGPVTDLRPLYDLARVFIAPTRFAAGTPTKVLEAAGSGLPVVGTDLLAEQLEWRNGHEMLSAPASDPAAFAAQIIRLVGEEKLWRRVRASALATITALRDPATFSSQVAAAMTVAQTTTRCDQDHVDRQQIVLEFEYLTVVTPGGGDLRELAVGFHEIRVLSGSGDELGTFDFRGSLPLGARPICGLSPAEAWGTWSQGPRTVLQLDLLRSPLHELKIVIEHTIAAGVPEGIPIIVSSGWEWKAQHTFRGGQIVIQTGPTIGHTERLEADHSAEAGPQTSGHPHEAALERQAVLVMGMHRSGTSAMAAALSLVGASPPRDLMPSMPDNPSGFWESVGITQLNDTLLDGVRLSWDDAFSFNGQQVLARPDNEQETRAGLILQECFADQPVIVMKDPRLSLLVPFWNRVLRRANYTPYYVIMVRDPRLVADSLQSRNGFSRQKGLLLWANYMVAVERETRGLPRCFVQFEDLLQSAETQLRRIGTTLDVPFLRDAELPCPGLVRLMKRGRRRPPCSWELGPFSRLMPFYQALTEAATDSVSLTSAAESVQDWLLELESVVGHAMHEHRHQRISIPAG